MHRYLTQVVLVSALAGGTTLSASAQDEQSATLENTSTPSAYEIAMTPERADLQTIQFIKEAARNNYRQMALTELATRKAKSPELISLAEALQQDHLQTDQLLQALARKYRVNLSPAMNAKSSRAVTSFFTRKKGAEWDQKFADALFQQHSKELDNYQRATIYLQVPEVKQFAKAQLPTLQRHLEQSRPLARTSKFDESIMADLPRVPAAVGGTSEQPGRFQDIDLNTGQGAATEKPAPQ